MDRIIINNKSKTDGFVQLMINDIVEKNGELVLTLYGTNNFCYNIFEGDEIIFKRVLPNENGTNKYILDKVNVIKEDKDHTIHATLPMNRKTYLNKEKKYEEITIDNQMYLIIYCADEHYLFAQDLSFYSTDPKNYVQQEIYFDNGIIDKKYYEIKPFQMFSKEIAVINDCIVSEEQLSSCGKNFEYYKKYTYVFSPESISKKMFLIKINYNNTSILNQFKNIIQNSNYFETKYNPFYYYTILVDYIRDSGELAPVEFDDYGNSIRHCYFYYDKWFNSLTNNTANGIEYFNLGDYINGAFFNMAYYFSNITFYSDSDESTLGSEDNFNEDFLEKIEESLVPEVIDFEKIKYVPYYLSSDNEYYPINEIIIHPHFRKRVLVDQDNNTNTVSTSGNLYYDGWYIDKTYEPDIFWNGYEGTSSYTDVRDFINNSGETSDLIGFLNFTDNDIYYRKNKVSKSFFRLLFYDSNDIIEQHLLFYSTIFIDSSELFNKFIKQKSFILGSDEENIKINDIAVSGDVVNNNVKVVFCENNDVDSRLDTTITITNEYNNEKSAEGYNLYLFSDDAPLEEEEKTIYLKIEFNHAGNGMVVPMILMPIDENLTTNNFFEYLFIKLKLKKINDKYVYIFDKGSYHENGDLHLCILEPKLEQI